MSAFIIIAGCGVVFLLFVAVTWAYDRGRIDAINELVEELEEENEARGQRLPPMPDNLAWTRSDNLPTP